MGPGAWLCPCCTCCYDGECHPCSEDNKTVYKSWLKTFIFWVSILDIAMFVAELAVGGFESPSINPMLGALLLHCRFSNAFFFSSMAASVLLFVRANCSFGAVCKGPPTTTMLLMGGKFSPWMQPPYWEVYRYIVRTLSVASTRGALSDRIASHLPTRGIYPYYLQLAYSAPAWLTAGAHLRHSENSCAVFGVRYCG